MVMGCYGIGVGRTMAAIIEQNSDENGIIWPMAAAPFQVIIVPTNMSDENVLQIAEALYTNLMNAGVEVLMDDRDERPGVKFKDADLVGIPLRITVGRKAAEGLVEFKKRGGGEVCELSVSEVAEAVFEEIKK